ncbi:L-dopachrome tautomerase-related protein [Flavobacterium akiainvivens]|uniref:L-dopachrome tautomerase-related protein n=1 Tax=Flavobacterium akiainvivens TaxID=1202724 RepID=UPI0008E77301|nr:L-dopachrome tautomerase-related protein [Flavobacterium akiainvivens]SFQ55072.1 Cupin domain-containing protein [Flavobacterium akiainvivens]
MAKNLITAIALAIAWVGQAQQVQHFSFKSLPVKQVNELLTRGTISGESGTIGYFTYKKGAVVPVHQHINEQYSVITQGSVKVLVEGKEVIVKAGEGIIIPANVPHSFIALEDNTIDIDFFTPARMDWIAGTDNYFTKTDTKATVSAKWNGKVTTPEVYATVENAVGNIAYTSQGDLVYSNHPFFNPDIRVVKYDAKAKTSSPFPNLEWNTPRDTDDHYLSNVLGIRNDANGIIWMLDMGQRNAITPKIVGWNTRTDKLERIYYLPQTAVATTSQPNDMVVDTKHGVFIIADEGIGNGGDGNKAALIVVDMKTGATRRLLEGTRTTLPENTPTVINGKPLAINGKNLLVGADGITADAGFEWLYYAPLNGSKIYRVKIDDILNETFLQAELDKRVETYSAKPNNGGLSIDAEGNIYLTALETNSIDVVLAKDRSVHRFVIDNNMLWPDGVSYNAADGYMYVSAAQVHLGEVFNNGQNKATAPFYIFRFKPLVAGVPFR